MLVPNLAPYSCQLHDVHLCPTTANTNKTLYPYLDFTLTLTVPLWVLICANIAMLRV